MATTSARGSVPIRVSLLREWITLRARTIFVNMRASRAIDRISTQPTRKGYL